MMRDDKNMYSKILEDFLLLTESERKRRLVITLGEKNFIPDEVVATLMLLSWREAWPDADTYAQHLIFRLTRHVQAHVRKNSGWQLRGGGFETTTEEFCGDILELMIKDKAQPCHAEVAFGNYVKKRCLDCADKLYAKKKSAGKSFDIDGVKAEVEANQRNRPDLFTNSPVTPEDELIKIEEYVEKLLADSQNLIRIEEVVQLHLSDKERMAFTFHFYGKLKVFSKKTEAITVAKLMGVKERSARQHLASAIQIIKERLA